VTNEFQGKQLDRQLDALLFLCCICETGNIGIKVDGLEISDDRPQKTMNGQLGMIYMVLLEHIWEEWKRRTLATSINVGFIQPFSSI